MEQDLGAVAGGTRDAIAITRGEDRDSGVPGEDVGAAVANAGAAREVFDQPDASAKTEYRLGVHGFEQSAGAGEDAKLKQADAHGVEGAADLEGFDAGAVVGVDKQAGAVEAGAAGEREEEAAALKGGELRVVVGAGKMGEHARKAEAGGVVDKLIHVLRLFVPDPEAAHAGVNLQVDVQGTSGVARHRGEAGNFLGGGHGRRDIELGDVAILLRQNRA